MEDWGFIESVEQEYNSENSCNRNIGVPYLFSHVIFKENSVCLDYGGADLDITTEYLATRGVENFIYDPFYRSKEHNDAVIAEIIKRGGADYVVCSNVLNVIKEESARETILHNLRRMAKPNGILYLCVFEGKKDGVGRLTKWGNWQNNRKLSSYLPEIHKFFHNTFVVHKHIIVGHVDPNMKLNRQDFYKADLVPMGEKRK